MGVWLSATAEPPSVPPVPVLASSAAPPFASSVAPLPVSAGPEMPPPPPVPGPPAPPTADPPVPCVPGPCGPSPPGEAPPGDLPLPQAPASKAMTTTETCMIRIDAFQSSRAPKNCEVFSGLNTHPMNIVSRHGAPAPAPLHEEAPGPRPPSPAGEGDEVSDTLRVVRVRSTTRSCCASCCTAWSSRTGPPTLRAAPASSDTPFHGQHLVVSAAGRMLSPGGTDGCEEACQRGPEGAG